MIRVVPRRGLRALVAMTSALAMTLVGVGAAGADTDRAGAAPTTTTAAAAVPASWSFSGSGFGHGVGMSQYGALAQAKAGRSAQQILASYYTGTTYDQVPDTQTIRVNIVSGATTTSVSGRATGTNGGRLTVVGGGRTLTTGAGQTLTLRRSGSSVVASCSGCSPTSVSGSSVQVTWDESRTDLGLGAKRYRHAPFVITPTPGAATLQGVLHLRLADEYLDQIREVPWSWPGAALEAQAAAARSYALRKVSAGVRSACACHVHDSISDQVYGPVPEGAEASAWPQWRAAVAAGGSSTTGYVPRYGGQIIEALYSSSSSGRTVNNEDVFLGEPVPYLRSVSDPWSTSADNPRRSWTTTVTGTKLASAFGLPDVAALNLSDRTSAGTVRTAVATSSTGATRSMGGDAMRRALGLSSAATQRPISRTAGASAADLAAEVARSSVPVSARSVVIASSYESDVAHLVMARPLAGSLGAPLLLSGRNQLTGATVRELDRRGSQVTRAYVVAGSPMVTSSVVDQLRARGIAVTRVGLSDKDATGAAVVDLMRQQGPVTVAAASTQASVPEAGAFAAVAGPRREPIVWAGSTRVGWRSKAALTRAGVRTVRLIGPTTRVPSAVASDLVASGFRTMRFSGSSSSLVSAQLADYFRNSYTGTRVVLARTGGGRTSDPAIAAGQRAPVLVVTTSAPGSVTSLVQRSPQWPAVRALGPTTRVSSASLTKVRRA
ncbi:SpoIID/LytB domain-containing protein [Janibacter sp. YB324]|uniref:SpoIID/LytB domain-containing protein n=1 Tax=Janibacter sp. YB324 TaxID=2761047 RepID=UPI001624CB74|nr:SpoIID/LytB domain-containing protein [Janibacter sp. YB324]QNF93396.1 SpoIID/LytB domain-containing protein [Janibacter sp. YB324]